MSAALAIKMLLKSMPSGMIFTTRDLIGIGSREAIDNCLCRLVQGGIILRLARGVFSNGDQVPHIAPFELAQIKARAFNKETYEHAITTAQRLGYIPWPQPKGEPLTFTTSGTGSSSFQSIFGTIRLKSAGARKRPQHRNEVWELVKSLWCLGNGAISDRIYRRVVEVWGRKSQQSLQKFCASIPQWLVEQLPANSKVAFDAIMESLVKPAIIEASNIAAGKCSCPRDSDCICPVMSCKHCQSLPIRNRFSIAFG